MIKRISLFAVLLFIGVFAVAQTQSEKEIKVLLANKWKLTHVEFGGQKIEMPPEAGDSFLDFKADGTILKIDSEGEIKGKWSYDHSTKIINTEDEDGVEKYEILKISETEFSFKTTAEGQTVSMTLKRVK
jgi:hypothetical protein